MSYPNLKDKILNNKEELTDKIMAEQMIIMPEIKDSYNQKMLKKSREDTAHNLNYLAQSLYIDDKNIFSNYFSWLNSILIGIGLEEDILKKHLTAMKNVFEKELDSNEYKYLKTFLDRAAAELNSKNIYDKSLITDDNPYKGEAEKYLSYLLNMQREKAVNLILEIADELNIEEIYLNIFQVVQQEIGRLWQLNKIGVAEEHYATSITQLVISQLYPKIFNSFNKGKKVLTSCIGDELHELGIRMVADLLELNGWDTIHLGANSPLNEIIKILKEREIDILAISATIPTHLEQTKELIDAVKTNDNLNNVKIMVGGRLFLESSDDLWQKLGADAFARDAKEAVKVADFLL